MVWKTESMENQLSTFSKLIGNRHIGCREPLTDERIDQLIAACTANNIPFNFTNLAEGNSLIYWVHNYSSTDYDDLYQVKYDWVCPLLDWWLFMYLSWEEFFALVQGSHVFQNQAYYDKLVATYDEPFKKRDSANIEMNMNALFNAGYYAVVQ